MKRLFFACLFFSSIAFGQIDTVRQSDTPNQGRVRINQSLNYLGQSILGRRVDTTGWGGLRRPILVLQGDTVWVAKEGIIVGADSNDIIMMYSTDSLGRFAKEYQVYKAPTTPMVTGVNDNTLGKLGVFSGADATTLWYGSMAKDSNGVLVYGYAYGGSQLRYVTSSDNGKTWSSFSIAASAPTGHTFEACSFGITPTGTWVFIGREDTLESQTKCLRLRSYRSTNAGSTWTLTDTITTTMSAGITGGIKHFSDSTLISTYSEGDFGYASLDTLYGLPSNMDTTYIKVVKSTDDGVTWSAPIIAYAHHDSVYQLNQPWLDEPAVAIDGSDHALILCRNPDYGTSQLVSEDSGATWTFVGVVGQTNCGPGAYSANPTVDVTTVNDSTFLFVVGYRLMHLGSGGGNAGKIGYTHFLSGPWNEIKDNATFGWSTFIPPTYSEYGDCGARRIAVTNDSCIAMVQMQGGSYYRITPAVVADSRAGWMLSGRKSSQYRPMQSYVWNDRIMLTTTTWDELFDFSIMSVPQYDSVTTFAIGAIPVVRVTAYISDIGGADTTWVKIVDVNDITMPSGTADGLSWIFTDGVDYVADFSWGTWFPTKLRDAGGGTVLGQFEKQVARCIVKIKSSGNNATLYNLGFHFGYIYQ